MTSSQYTPSNEMSTQVEAVRLRRIVVGVDGSPNSVAALRFAVGLAVRDDAMVEVVCAYEPQLQVRYPFPPALPPYGPADNGLGEALPPRVDVGDAGADAQLILEHAMKTAFGRMELPNVELIPAEGHPQEVLRHIAAHADLLVVGAQGHSGPLGLLLGSTALACVKRAPCAVLVVPSGS